MYRCGVFSTAAYIRFVWHHLQELQRPGSAWEWSGNVAAVFNWSTSLSHLSLSNKPNLPNNAVAPPPIRERSSVKSAPSAAYIIIQGNFMNNFQCVEKKILMNTLVNFFLFLAVFTVVLVLNTFCYQLIHFLALCLSFLTHFLITWALLLFIIWVLQFTFCLWLIVCCASHLSQTAGCVFGPHQTNQTNRTLGGKQTRA